MKKLLLCGYMGSGKSTVARLLSQKINLTAFDLDELIEQKAGISIKHIFEQKGELYFRKLEHQVFTSVMKSDDSFILALGGGTPAYANNHELLKGENVISFYLKASIETLCKRLSLEHEHRPLIAGMTEENMKENIAKHLFDRNFYYLQSTHVISIDDKTVEQVTQEIIGKLT